MVSATKARFELDARLAADTVPVERLGLCTLLAMNDRRWPWLILVPMRPLVAELHELTPLDQAMLTFESNMAAVALKRVTQCTKINTAALGNIVRQLHVHVVARSEGDPNWPGPVWGHGKRETWDEEGLRKFAAAVRAAL